jgi:hypothetical protein
MRCARCGSENEAGVAECRKCRARLGAYARPAPTVPDAAQRIEASPAVGRVLARSSGAPLVVRTVVDAVRVAIALALAAFVWSSVSTGVDALIGRAIGSSAAPLASGALALLLAAAVTALTFRITSRRFVRPLRSASW